MTTPTTRTQPGTLGAAAYDANGDATSDVFVRLKQWTRIALYVHPDHDGTVQLWRYDSFGEQHEHGAAVGVTGGKDQMVASLEDPFGALELTYTNTSGDAGLVKFEVRASQGA